MYSNSSTTSKARAKSPIKILQAITSLTGPDHTPYASHYEDEK